MSTPLLSSVRWSSTAAALVAVASVVVITRVRPDRPITLGSVYALLFALFHTGLLIPIALGIPVELLNPGDERWVGAEGFARASLYVAVAQCAFTIGYLLLAHARQTSPIEGKAASASAAHADPPGFVGISLLFVGIGLWLLLVVRGGVALFGGSYSDLLKGTAGTSMPIAHLLIGFGAGVTAASRNTVARRVALVAFAIWAVPAFTLGLRGEVIIPAAAYLVTAARRRQIALRPWMAFAALAVLAAGSAVRVIRQFGLGKAAAGLESASPVSGLTELGYSIRPVIVVVGYRARGEPFVGYETYLAPVRRLVVSRLTGAQPLSAADDPAVFGTMIARRVGPIGGSVAAEAYRSGGVVGIVAVLAAIGLAVAYLDSRKSTMYADSTVGMISFSFLLWIRNDFTPVPLHFALASIVVSVIWVLARLAKHAHLETPSRSRAAM